MQAAGDETDTGQNRFPRRLLIAAGARRRGAPLSMVDELPAAL